MLGGGAGQEVLLERCWGVPAAAGLLEGAGAALWEKMAPALARLQCMSRDAAPKSAADPDPTDALVTVKDGPHRHRSCSSAAV